MKRYRLAFVSILFPAILLGMVLLAHARPKELPMLVTIQDLMSDPGQYDGHRIVVTGRVRSIEYERGRRGSRFIKIVLEESRPSANEIYVNVVSFTLPPVRQGHHALVQGVYHLEGRQAGRPFEHFVDAQVILREEI